MTEGQRTGTIITISVAAAAAMLAIGLRTEPQEPLLLHLGAITVAWFVAFLFLAQTPTRTPGNDGG